LCAHPTRTVSQLELLDAPERRHLLRGLNDTAVDFPAGTFLHQLFEAQVAATPEAIALVSDAGRLSYRELNERSNRLAHALVALGVKPDDRVGLCCERGAELIVGMLGILKSGGAYVPLDPAYPADRLAYMVQDSRPVAVLTQAALREVVDGWLDPSAPVPVIALDGVVDARIAGQPASDIEPSTLSLSTSHLAYVIYTSGSTGKPKGVMNQHDGVVNSVRWAQSEFRLTPADRLLQKTSYSFDVSIWEVFVPLMSGAVLVMARPGGHRDPDYVADVIQRESVTVVQFVPSMLQIFLDHADLSRCGSLRLVISGGEALPAALQQRFHALLPNVRLHNVYGPTEAAVYVTQWPCAPRDAFVPIGVPLANTQIYILDAHLEPVPLGVIGELFIGGVQVARGYLNRPELNAERFIPDPFSDRPGATLYRTGDLARRRSDGRLEFLGRNDFQVKIQGHRIELGDIESLLQQFPGVREAVVVARADAAGEARLVAYYSSTDAAEVTISRLRQHLLAGLPAYMVPAHFVAMESFPSTANGKLDRNALPEPEAGREGLSVAYEPPVGAREQRICAEFSAALGVASVGRHDNFFDLGGNSLLALRMLARLQKLEDRPLPAPLIFGNPTPAALALAIEGGESEVLELSRLPSSHRSVAVAAERLAGTQRGSVHEPIAIIGMAGRFPGASDVETFWRNLREGLDTITRFEPEELDPWVSKETRDNPRYVRARGVLEGYDLFDASFFGISAREAELMDPQQRIFLELCWECMERAGHVPDSAEVPVGVFAGAWDSTYFRHHVSAHPDLMARLGALNVMIGNEKDYFATRVAHKLNLTGPAIGVYTACSTGLVAACQAMDSLRLGHCDMALAGGVSIACPPNTGYEYLEGAMFSPDGHTRAFDAKAQGTVFNDGAAVVLLKRLSDALADGDHVHALLLGGAVNNDGGAKSSFTAPSAEGQAALVAMAQANAGVSPRTISYVEAHGTGTPIGDPIEVAGLTKAFRRFTSDTGFCRLGSVKSNVGHLITAAGGAGLIKTALAMEHRLLPPSVNFERNNPSIDFAG
jgi:amino acid adenylation domain-containing protein